MFIKHFFHNKCRRCHRDAQGFRFIATGNGTAIIIGKDDHWPVFELRFKNSFTGAVKIVAIY